VPEPSSTNGPSNPPSPLNYPIVFSIALALIVLLLVAMCSGNRDSAPARASDCRFSDVQSELDRFISELRSRMATQDTRVLACNDYADLLSGNNSDADMTVTLLPSDRSCMFLDSDRAKRYLRSRANAFRAQADRICGAELARRIEAGNLRVEFSDIVRNATAGEAARRIGHRMALFAPDLELRNCLEAAGIRNEPAVMSQPFNQIVAACEVMLRLPAQSPEQRWPLPSIDDPAVQPETTTLRDGNAVGAPVANLTDTNLSNESGED
jgi:hypothetical protein